ncbi:MAG TPA: glucuronyl hydrolase [Puia sp.]|nr:glucuronyl hydrolase [Puia sp.]
MEKMLTVMLLVSVIQSQRVGAQRPERLQPKAGLVRLIDGNLRQAVNQYKILMGKVPADRMPRSYTAGTATLVTSDAGWWTSGFYPATLFYLYKDSHDTALLDEGERRLKLLEMEQYNRGTHDLGFMMYLPYGNLLKLIHHSRLREPEAPADSILMNSARSLATRFNPTVGCIRSWDSKPWNYPVIIDNMMNLELLFWATRESGDSSFYRIAVTHANTTMRNHFRSDYSSYHVVDYDTLTGRVLAKKTAQGYADSSAWARGQSWGLYGYTMVYRWTRDPKYLEQAMHIADYILSRLPADKVPYWDYDAPGGPRVLRDVSAAAILASGLIELSRDAPAGKGRGYLDVAEEIIVALSSSTYHAVVGANGGFLLMHSVGNLPGHSEIDVPLAYADYYFVEAMLRYKELEHPELW